MLALVNLFLVFAAGVASEEAVSNVNVSGDLGQNYLTLVTAINETDAEDLMKHVFDHSIASFLENLYGGISAEIVNNRFTYDEDGHPMIDVNQAQTLLMSSLLTKFDESFHSEWPGQFTVIPEENFSKELNDKEEYEKFAQDGHVLASTVDDTLVGHVHLDDEEDLKQMMEQPPKLKRVRRAFMFRRPNGKPSTWPGGIIPYVFDRNVNNEAKQAATDSMKFVMSRIPCIKFEPANQNTKDYVLITSNGNGCFAHIGKKEGQNAYNLGNGCGYVVAVHEWGHTIGALHTQTRPDRDNFVEINWGNVNPDGLGNFYMNEVILQKDDSEYDYDSVMHYPTFAFPIDSRYQTLRVKAPNTFDLPSHAHREGFSDQDEESFRLWYGCPADDDQGENYEEDDDECAVSRWGRYGQCMGGFKTKMRQVLSGNCDPYHLVKLKKCRGKSGSGRRRRSFRNSKSKRDAGSEESNDTDTVDAVGDGDRAEARMSKLLEVNVGEPIVLIFSNPKNFSVEWYHVVDGQDVNIEKDSEVYSITRTKVGNERLVIEKNELEDDGHVFFAKILMSHSVLKISWDISVDSLKIEP